MRSAGRRKRHRASGCRARSSPWSCGDRRQGPDSSVRGGPGRRTRAAVALLLAAATLPACTRGPRPLPPAEAASVLLQRLAARREAVTSLRARARLRSGLEGLWTRQAVVVDRPDRIRVDVLTPMGLALALGTEHARLWAYQPSERVRYEGGATPQ